MDELSLRLRLRNNDEDLYNYVYDLANAIFDGDYDSLLEQDEEYDPSEFDDYEACFLYAISIALNSMFDTKEFTQEEYIKEYNKAYDRIINIEMMLDDELEEEEYE